MTDQPPTPAPNVASASSTINIHGSASPSNGLAVTSLVLGIIAVVTCWIPVVGFIGLICAIVGLVIGIIGVQRPLGRGLAIGGIICSAFALLVWIVGIIFLSAILTAAASAAH
jgi:hypothetical protein